MTEPSNVNVAAGEPAICGEWVELGVGENKVRFVCQLPPGHKGPHATTFGSADINAQLSWVHKDPPPAPKKAKKVRPKDGKAKPAKKAAKRR